MDFMQTRDGDYRCEQANLRGYLAWNDSAEPRPGILVFHEGLGVGDFGMERVRRLAGLGDVPLAAETSGVWRPGRGLRGTGALVRGLLAGPEEPHAPGQ